jgi:hypothetical protein
MNVTDFDGTMLDATFSVGVDGGKTTLVYESSGGRAGGPNPRNLDYRRGLGVLLRRLQAMNALVEEIRVETERTRALPLEQQRVVIDGQAFPMRLAPHVDLERFRKDISRYARRVGQDAEKLARPGGSSRRLRFFLAEVPTEQSALERQLSGSGAEAEADAVETVVELVAGRGRARGQGFLISHAVRKCVEDYAMRWAVQHYENEGWSVSNVSATKSYDLQCTRGAQRLHVEVKGTTTAGETVILTRNEVTHAEQEHPFVELFVVAEIVVDGSASDSPHARGGHAHVRKEWSPEADRLLPVGYVYSTALADAAWADVQMPAPGT